MSLTSYRTAPPRVIGVSGSNSREANSRGGQAHAADITNRFACTACCVARERSGFGRPGSDLLFRISVMQYHRRRGVSRPSSEWDRVQNPRYDHQAGKTRKLTRTQLVGKHILAEDTAGSAAIGSLGPETSQSD